MKIIIYSKVHGEKEILIDKKDWSKVNQYRWCIYCKKKPAYKAFYVYSSKLINGHRVFLHRFILNFPKGKVIDHKNGNGLDNRRKNLRICTQSENMCNQRKGPKNTSGYKGVYFHKARNKYQAQIKINHKVIYLGIFSNKKVAYTAYCKASKKYHKEYGRTK